jgi:cystathionine beta-lyase
MSSHPLFPSLDALRSRQSAKWRDHPPHVLPLDVAEADVQLAEPVARALVEAIERSDTGYASRRNDVGVAFTGFAARRWGWEPDPGQISIVPEVGVAVVEALRVLLDAGDPVVINPPVYPPFWEWVREAGLVPVEVPLIRTDEAWRLDLDGLARAFAAGAKAYLLCNPHNPAGRVHTVQELRVIADLAAEHDAWVISDEIHAPLTYSGDDFTPYLTVGDGARRRGVVATSASKGWNLAGLKCGVLVTQSQNTVALHRRLPGETRWRVGHLGVIASVAAYRDADDWLESVVTALDANRRQLARRLGQRLESAGYQPPQAGYLAWIDVAPLGWADDCAAELLQHHDLAVNAGTDFGAAGSGHIRVNFACPPEVIDRAVDALTAYHLRLSDGL